MTVDGFSNFIVSCGGYLPKRLRATTSSLIRGGGSGTSALHRWNFRPNNNIIRQQANSLLGKHLAGRELTLRGHIAGDDGNYPSLAAWYAAEGSAILAQFADAASVATVHAAPTAYLVYHEVVEGSGSGSLRTSPNQNVGVRQWLLSSERGAVHPAFARHYPLNPPTARRRALTSSPSPEPTGRGDNRGQFGT